MQSVRILSADKHVIARFKYQNVKERAAVSSGIRHHREGFELWDKLEQSVIVNHRAR